MIFKTNNFFTFISFAFKLALGLIFDPISGPVFSLFLSFVLGFAFDGIIFFAFFAITTLMATIVVDLNIFWHYRKIITAKNFIGFKICIQK